MVQDHLRRTQTCCYCKLPSQVYFFFHYNQGDTSTELYCFHKLRSNKMAKAASQSCAVRVSGKRWQVDVAIAALRFSDIVSRSRPDGQYTVFVHGVQVASSIGMRPNAYRSYPPRKEVTMSLPSLDVGTSRWLVVLS